MDKALQTQLGNIEKRTGKTIDALTKLIKGSGLTKHGEVRDWLQKELGMGHGDANTLVHVAFQSSPAVTGDTETDVAAADRSTRGRRPRCARSTTP